MASALRHSATLLLALLLGACAPRADISAPAAAPPAETQPDIPAPSATALAPDRSCRLASDCTVRNVGNCCGYFPACVNKDAEVDPEAVRAQCERDGLSSVCGWQEIEACDCVQGQCTASNALKPVTR
ncbi:hypothetical protein [Luteimonas sp. SDU101]|uniref:hypothetical protein n=1 Tax=unclassified Luteimonas TaxID=2629088 RepID=UPI003EBF3D5D